MFYKKENGTGRPSIFVEFILPVLVPVLLICFWQLMSGIGLLNPAILPSPSTIATTFWSMLMNGQIIDDMRMSLLRVLSGFLLGSVAGLVIGVICGLFHKFDKAITIIVGVLRPIPVIALIPLFILWMGIGESSKIALIMVGAFWPMLINTIYGIKTVDQKLVEVAVIMEKSRKEMLFSIVLPSALPSMIAGVRLGASNAWACVVASEMIAASSGIGYLVMYAREVSQPDVMLVGILLIGLFGLLIDFLLVRMEKRMFRWRDVGANT